MESAETTVEQGANDNGQTPPELGAIYAFVRAIRTRIISGLILALPIAITFWIVVQLIQTLNALVIDPTIEVIRWLVGPERMYVLPAWWRRFLSPVVALGCVLGLLYFLGLVVSTRLAKFIDWVMSRVPVVTTIYHTVRGVFQSLGNQKGPGRFKRVVSVAFGGPGLRVPGFVTQTMREAATGRTILSVFVPFAPLPTSGFVLLVPEDDVVDLGWSVNETMQGIVSGGLSMPPTVQFAPDQGVDGASGSISA
jgi:uncharacterized membrane protein